MAGDDIEINITTKMAEALRAWSDLHNSISKVVAKVDSVGKESQKSNQIQKELGDSARRVWEQTRTTAERAELEQAKLNKLYKDGYIDVETYRRAQERLGSAGQTTWGRMKEWAGSAAGQILGVTSAAGALLAALRLVQDQLAANARLQDAAAGHQRSEANPIRTLLLSVGSGADMSGAQAVESIRGIAGKRKADVIESLAAASSVYSARGSRTVAEANAYFDAALRMNPSNPEESGKVASAAMALTQNEAGTPEQAIGQIYQGMKSARVPNANQYVTGVIPGVTSMAKSGASSREAMALIGALSLETGDATGSQSATAGVQLLAQLDKAVRTVDPSVRGLEAQRKFLFETDVGKRLRDELVGPLAGRLGDGKRLKKSQTPAALHGEEKMLAAMVQFLTPGSQTAQTYEAGLASIPAMSGGSAAYEDLLVQQAAISGLETASISEAGKSALQKLLGKSRGGAAAALRESVNELRAFDQSTPKVFQWAEQTGFDALMSKRDLTPVERYDIALNELDSIRPKYSPRETLDRIGIGLADTRDGLSQDDRDLIEAINELTEELRSQKRAAMSRSSTNGPVPAVGRGERTP